ncbi:cupin domain-containing protein [Aneurinibacillus sp. Ricciae_BoGa-3]|uniref:cupin domain-containing protein n=1 Tax=Aneurinibacillus sp. Ricciae_BoGa-3 TaxID=3022697 RepID=UPI0023424064|nr:cupin domain-containing protein [Aneurinibacillus sp. Ricciae_BoGa-3]WCK55973.1 cupin domain-containing protein [Aneurinibacillus sp. Ricciae_BoGa-3]
MQVVKLKNLIEEKQIARAKVLSFDKGDIVNLQVKTGEKIARHQTPCDAVVTVVSGEVLFSAGEEAVRLTPGMLIHLKPHEDHELLAIEDASLLVMKIGENRNCGHHG